MKKQRKSSKNITQEASDEVIKGIDVAQENLVQQQDSIAQQQISQENLSKVDLKQKLKARQQLPCSIIAIESAFSGALMGALFGLVTGVATGKGGIKARWSGGLLSAGQTAKSFAVMTSVYTAAICFAKRIRLKADEWNHLLAGCVSGAAIGIGSRQQMIAYAIQIGSASYLFSRFGLTQDDDDLPQVQAFNYDSQGLYSLVGKDTLKQKEESKGLKKIQSQDKQNKSKISIQKVQGNHSKQSFMVMDDMEIKLNNCNIEFQDQLRFRGTKWGQDGRSYNHQQEASIQQNLQDMEDCKVCRRNTLINKLQQGIQDKIQWRNAS